ncbi:LysM peptidoglycan-binding domain-containing protein [Rhodonellum sp.]|uniref:CIS tube protein n=1 Tax=Rhodonellum sp. TaxID=2231180 RepID=UPI00271B4A1D|nr:LysM peptidoglycan-binding domain-containing protein [Rhodonellum sp.]MDO9554658.1 LysM peptidoglycan-binding domain-containing protein [Rhodonellum sp.]
MSEGKINKVKIVAYSDPDYSDQLGEYEVLVNPSKTSKKGQLEYTNNSSPIGGSAETIKFKGAGPEKYEFNFFFDGTGIITSKKVDDQVEELIKLMYSYNGDIHEPNYIKIYWGTQSEFQGRLTSFEQVNTMMDTDGTPLRAEIKASFIGSKSPEKKALEAGKNSADLTHIRTVFAGDTLPLMCFRIYGDSGFYMKVAEFNQLDNFRDISPGDQIIFPPVI